MAEIAAGGKSGKVVIRNIGLLLSGDIDKPILDADTIVVNDGLIVAVGKEKDCDLEGAVTVIDAKKTCVAPGLIDSHVHPVFGDWTPRQGQLGWIDSTMHGGVTTMISAGEVHLPGRPKDIVGLKALAITAQRAFDNFRPGGVKVLAGAPVIEKGMVESDFKELAEAGVGLLGEVGLGSVKAGYEAKEMVAWARKYGIQSTIHTGGPSIPGSGLEQITQHPEIGARQGQGLAIRGVQQALYIIETITGELALGGGRAIHDGLGPCLPAHHRLDSGHQLTGLERLGQVVIGAHLQANDAIQR